MRLFRRTWFAHARPTRGALIGVKQDVAEYGDAGEDIDSRREGVLPGAYFVVYWSWATFYIALGGVAFFLVTSWFGLTVPSMLRLIRRWLVGPVRPAVPTWKRRRLA